jgi:DNA repair exonuclease SbcCD ATPase subunit
MSWKASWGGEQQPQKWGSSDSWGGDAGSSWSKPSSEDSWDSWGSSKGASKGDSKGAPAAKGITVKPPSTVKPPVKKQEESSWGQESSWSQEPAWKKQNTGDSWSSGKGGDSWQKEEDSWQPKQDSWQSNKGKGGGSWQKGGKAEQAAGPTPQEKAAAAKAKLEADKAKKTTEIKAKSDKATRDVEMAEKLATPVMEKAKKLIEDEKATAAAMKVSVDGLEKQTAKAKELADAIQKDVEECRKAGPLGKDFLQDLQKAMVKANGIKNQVNIVIAKLKPKAEKQQKEAEAKAKAAKEEAERKAKETKDSASFKPILAKMTRDVTAVEEAVSGIEKKADAIVAKAPEDKAELDKATAEIEKSAGETFKKLNATRTELNEKFKGVAGFAPEAKKTSHAALSELQKKLVDSGKKASVYTAFKKELPKLVASKEGLAEVKEKLEGHDKAVTNATKLGDMPKLDKARIEAIDAQLEPVKKAVAEANAMIVQKMKNADAVSIGKFQDFRKKGDEMLKKIQAVYSKIKKERDVIMSDEYIEQAAEKLEKVEASWKSCQDAEMPFLTGVEVLEGEQNDAALKDCAEAITNALAAINDAKSFVQKKLADCKTSEKEVLEKMTAALTPISTKITAVEANVTKFKKEHAERKILSVMSTAIDALEALEKKVAEVEKQGKTLTASDIEDESVEVISEAAEKTKAVVQEASAKFTEAKKLVADKMHEAKANQANEKIAKINSRMNAANEKLTKVKSAIATADRVVKAKKAISAGEEKVTEAEAEVAKVEKFEGKEFTAIREGIHRRVCQCIERDQECRPNCSATRRSCTGKGQRDAAGTLEAQRGSKKDDRKAED